MRGRARMASPLTAPALAAALALAAGAAAAQPVPVLELTEDLDFDRPEAWAMKYFSSLTLLTGMGVPDRREPGSVELAAEAGWAPSLSREERTVGFFGSKEEDLNKTPVFGRGRVTVGLPAGLTATLAWVPPVEVGGMKPNLLAAAVGRPLVEAGRFRLGARLFAQTGTIEGDVTCDRDTVAAGTDPARNPFGCSAPSRDEITLRYAGLEVAASYTAGRLEPYAALAASRVEAEFQVDALYSGFRDRTLQLTDGTVASLAAGVRWAAAERAHLVAEAFWAPLDIIRRPGAPTTRQDLFNLRLLLAYRVR